MAQDKNLLFLRKVGKRDMGAFNTVYKYLKPAITLHTVCFHLSKEELLRFITASSHLWWEQLKINDMALVEVLHQGVVQVSDAVLLSCCSHHLGLHENIP